MNTAWKPLGRTGEPPLPSTQIGLPSSFGSWHINWFPLSTYVCAMYWLIALDSKSVRSPSCKVGSHVNWNKLELELFLVQASKHSLRRRGEYASVDLHCRRKRRPTGFAD
ncbi:unnamed protein product [Camellia sinensis]